MERLKTQLYAWRDIATEEGVPIFHYVVRDAGAYVNDQEVGAWHQGNRAQRSRQAVGTQRVGRAIVHLERSGGEARQLDHPSGCRLCPLRESLGHCARMAPGDGLPLRLLAVGQCGCCGCDGGSGAPIRHVGVREGDAVRRLAVGKGHQLRARIANVNS